MSIQPVWDRDTLAEELDRHLECELNRLNMDLHKIADRLLEFTPYEQGKALHWIRAGCKTHSSIGSVIATHIAEAMRCMDSQMLEAWVVHGMQLMDTKGLLPAIQALQAVGQFAAEAQERARGVTFQEVSGMLTLFVHGLSGRKLKLEEYENAWTDTETIYLPHYVGRFESHQDNFRLYKSILVHQWAQLWFGTWQVEMTSVKEGERQPELHLLGEITAQAWPVETVLPYLHRLETIRLHACIARELPGVYRDMQHVLSLLGEQLIPPGWETLAGELQHPDCGVMDSCRLLPRVLGAELPAALVFQGQWRLAELEAALQARLRKEKKQFQKAVWKMSEEQKKKAKQKPPQEAEAETAPEQPETRLQESENQSLPEDFRFDILIDDEPVLLSPEMRDLMNSILQDFRDIPEEYLHAGFAGAYEADEEGKKTSDPWSGVYHEEGAFFYNEWDYQRQHYRKDWCVVRELEVKPGNPAFVLRTLHKYHKLIKQLHKSFEALRGEDKLLKQQVNGDDVDIEAVVEAWADAHCGMEMSDRLYTQMQRVERSIAVMFMVDMSGSTKGWINEAERESLILLCEALEKLGDRYAIYGFSGWARKRCEIFSVKTFEDAYNEDTKARIAGIEAQNYTRMGMAIRHLSQILNQVEAKTRVLVTLSDGRPEDYDEYRGKYGIEDTRMALIEARRSGIHPFCITIDKQGLEYLPHMYGKASYVVLDDVAKLPLKVADIYRKLTT